MPASFPAPSTMPMQPKLFAVIKSSASAIGVSAPTSGSSSPACMMSDTFTNRLPSWPPGCKAWNFSSEKPCRLSKAIAITSPSTSIMVVEVVGASSSGQASRMSASTIAASAARARALPARPVMAINGMFWRRVCATMSDSSGVSPELDR